VAKAEANVEDLLVMIQRCELRLPEVPAKVRLAFPRCRNLLESLLPSYPSDAIPPWETDEEVPLLESAVSQ
jgi:hypothetical protein